MQFLRRGSIVSRATGGRGEIVDNNQPTPAEQKQMPECVREYVWWLRHCCEDGGLYNTDEHRQPAPCGYQAIPDPDGKYEWIGKCDQPGCAIDATDGWSDDCAIHDEF